jgi:hypothetical protein
MRYPWTTAIASLALLAGSAAAQTTTFTSSNAAFEGLYGGSISSIPDINGDGKDDIIVGAPGEVFGAISDAGRVYVYNGATGALIRTHTSPTPRVGGGYGTSVTGIPDVNGDGRGDYAVGAPVESPADTFAAGKVYVYSGANGALIAQIISPARETGGNFGVSIAGMADCTGDGRGDLVIGAPGEDPGTSPANCGRAYLFRGTGQLWQKVLPPVALQNGAFGASVAFVPDADGDNRGDFVVGAPRVHHAQYSEPINCGRAYLMSGVTGRSLRHFRSPAYTEGGFFGTSVSGIPDVNGDGRGDVVVGAPGDHPGASPLGVGRAYVYNGATGGYIRVLIPPYAQANGEFGFSVAGIPDTNNDGRGDILVGGWKQNWPNLPLRSGVIHLYNGATGARLQSFLSPNAEEDGLLGATVTGIRDLNGNARAEIIGGATAENNGLTQTAGRVYLFRR